MRSGGQSWEDKTVLLRSYGSRGVQPRRRVEGPRPFALEAGVAVVDPEPLPESPFERFEDLWGIAGFAFQ